MIKLNFQKHFATLLVDDCFNRNKLQSAHKEEMLCNLISLLLLKWERV
jgi:hypothetical protein